MPNEIKAWDIIGWDDGKFTIKGGRTKYEAVGYNSKLNPANVKLMRIQATETGLRTIVRYVDPETILEIEDGDALQEFKEEFGIK